MSKVESQKPVNIAGPPFLGLIFTSVALGVLTVQVFLYHVSFPNDSLHLKLVVWSVYTMELIQTLSITYSLYQQFVYGFLDISSLDRISCNWFAVPILGGVVTFIVQIFYVHRIVVLGRFLGKRSVYVIAAFIAVISTVHLGGGIAVGVQLQQAAFYSHIAVNRILKASGTMYGAGTVADIAIAVCMTIILLRSSAGTMPRTRQIVRRLVRLTIEAGSLTAAMGIITIILVTLPIYETYYQVSTAALSKLYSNAMMAVLLSRAELSNQETSAQRDQLSTLRFSNSRGEESSGWSMRNRSL